MARDPLPLHATSAGVAADEWRQGWPIVVAGITGMTVASLHAYSLGAMIVPIEQEFGWSRAQISSGMTITSFLTVCFAPFMGFAIDRIGVRPIGLAGVTLFCAALAAISQATPNIWSWWILWTILGIALLHVKPTVWVAAVSRVFASSRGMAIAVVLSGTGVSTIATPIMTQYLVETFGWRVAYQLLAAGWAILGIPIIFLFLSRKPRTSTDQPRETETAVDPALGYSIKEGVKSLIFARLLLAVFLMSMANVGIIINLIPILTSKGMSPIMAASLAGFSGVATIVGRLVGGYLLDRINARHVAGASVFLPALACALLLLFPADMAATVAAILLIGFASGAEMDAVAYMAGRYFGMRNFGTLFGAMSGGMTLGVGLGPLAANHAYDVTGSYDMVLWWGIPLSIITSLLFWRAGPYPNFECQAHISTQRTGVDD